MDRKVGVRPRGNSIMIDFMYNGQRCRETLALPPTKPNMQHVYRMRESILFEIATNTFNYAKHFPNSKNLRHFSTGKNLTISNALLSFLESKKKTCAPSTYATYSSVVHYHLIPTFGDLYLAELKSSDVREWINELEISTKRINNALIPLRGIFDDAYYDEIIDRNPMDRIKNLTNTQREPNPFSLDEMEAILNVLPDQSRNYFQFAFLTGLRTSEMIALDWSDIDFDNQVVHVSRAWVCGAIKTTKTTNGIRDVKLHPQAIEALLAQNKHCSEGRVFLNPKTGLPWQNDNQVRRTAWIPALKKAGIEYRNPYQTRHTFASMLLSEGEPPMWVATQMGHADWSMIIKTYGRWIPANDEVAGSKIAKIGTNLSQEAASV